MNLSEYSFPTNPNHVPADLVQEAKKRGFYNGDTYWNKLFSTLFYSGALLKKREDVDQDFVSRAYTYVVQFMHSFALQHEEKEAVCALIFSEILDEQKTRKANLPTDET